MRKYSAEQLEFLRREYATLPIAALVVAFNARFGSEKTRGEIKSTLFNYRMVCGRKGGNPTGTLLAFTPEQAKFIAENYRTMTVAELTKAFNTHFGTRKKESSIKCFTGNHKVQSGRTGHFVKGQKTWNHGVTGYMGANVTSFKKGQIPPNKKRLWTERINRDGFIEISIPERNPHTGFPTRYRHKHVWLWEMANGPVPKGHVIAFVDGIKTHCELDNLMLLTRGELLTLNSHGYKDAPAELKPSLLALAKVEAKAGIRTCPGRGRQKK